MIKSYARFPRTPLPHDPVDASLGTLLARRKSFDVINPNGCLSLATLGTILGHALRTRSDRRPYPSGGALYPIETYIIGELVEAPQSYCYQYDTLDHSLVHLWEAPTISELFMEKAGPLGTVVLFFTSMWKRSTHKYGDVGYAHSLIEAGHMGQNILLVSSALEVDARPIAGFVDDRVIKLLDLDRGAELPVYSVTLGKK